MNLKYLDCPHLKSAQVVLLKQANINSTEQLVAYADLDYLSKQCSIPTNTLKAIKAYIIGKFAPMPCTMEDLLKRTMTTNNQSIIASTSTGNSSIDELIVNGIYPGELIEVCGKSSSGKTNFCLNLVAQALAKSSTNDHYLNQNQHIYYIDSNKNFCVKRLQKILVADEKLAKLILNKNYDNDILKRVKVVECHDLFTLINILTECCMSSSSNSNLNLLIIDNFHDYFIKLFHSNDRQQVDSQFYLHSILNQFKYLKTTFKTSIVLVTHNNQSVLYSSSPSSIFNDEYFLSSMNVILFFKKYIITGASTDNYSENQNGRHKFMCKLLKCNRPFRSSTNIKSNYTMYDISSK